MITAPGKILVVTAGGQNPQVMINALVARFGPLTVLLENPESKAVFLKRRARKLGWMQAAGQFATMVASRFGKRFTKARAAEILAQHGASDADNASVETIKVDSINGPEAIAAIRSLSPSVIFLISCRMLTRATLATLPCPVINFHAGINPAYRGLMGGYWARVNRDEGNFGATVHLVDAGVDTGDVLYQSRVTPSPRDTMHTYALLQTATGTSISIRAIEDALSGTLTPVPVTGPSRQWYHPPIWTYVWNGLTRRIW